MSISLFIRRHRILTAALLIIVGFVVYSHISAVILNKKVRDDVNSLSLQERSLNVPKPKEHTEKEMGCTYSERQNWDSEGCFMGLTDTYYEKGPDKKAEQQITTSLLNHGWQKRRSDLIWDSEAVMIYGNDGSFTKQTPEGRYCVGISYRYFSDDIQSGPRSVTLYMLSPSDHGCNRW